jgi:molybdopterin-guanine dinucleotide biosynthesis protein A
MKSQRCPNKLLRPFGNTTLTDILLSKFSQLDAETFFCGYEQEFADKCHEHRVRFVPRDERSASIDGPIHRVLGCLRDVEYDYLLLVNSCLPFLKVDTISKFLRTCMLNEHQPAFAVVQRHAYFMTADKQAVNFDINQRTRNTKTVDPVLEFAEALHYFRRSYFLQAGTFMDWSEVRFIELASRYELLDIDTEEDFAVAEALWRQEWTHNVTLP